MNDIIRTYQERFRRNRHTFRRYAALLLALAMITTLFVNWQLHGVGISMTADYQCGEIEHTHTEDCYTKMLVCGYNEGELENPDQVADTDTGDTTGSSDIALYDEPQIEWVPHEHTDACYTDVQVLTCTEEEHVHDDDCFDPEDGSLICDKFEHTHDESCYTTERELTCGLEEGELVEQEVEPTESAALFGEATAQPVATELPVDTTEPVYHHHTDACYEEVLTCPYPEHHHTVECLSDTEADVGVEDTALEAVEAQLSDVWSENLLLVAQSQLGYEQSEKNFRLDDDDHVTVRHYTRYGESYGNPYGEWDVMFLSYCLKNAQIPLDAVPQEAGVLALRSSMKGMEWLRDVTADDAALDLVPGDIVIYEKTATRTVAVDTTSSDSLTTENGTHDSLIAMLPADSTTAEPVDVGDFDDLVTLEPDTTPTTTTTTETVDTVGIVEDVDEETGTLTVISGDVDGKVAEVALALSDVKSMISVTAAQIALSGDDAAAVQPGADSTTTTYVDYFDETKDDKQGGITSTVIKVNDKEVTGNITLENNSKISLEYDYYIPAGVLDLAAGNDTLTYHLPEGLVPSESRTFELENGVGTMTVKEDGTVTLKFNNNFQPDKPFTGAFYLNATVKTDDIGDGGTITFPGDKASITVNNPRSISIDKKGTYDETDDKKQIIHYTVTVASGDGWDELIEIHDKLDNTGKVTGKYLQNTIKLVDKKGNEISLDNYLKWNCNGNDQSFDITNLPKLKKGEKYVLTYDVELTGAYDGSGSGSFHNAAWTNNNQKTDPWTWHSEYIKKEVSHNNEDGYMYWKVTVPNYYGGNLKGAEIKDKITTKDATIVGNVQIQYKNKDGQYVDYKSFNADGEDGFTYKFEEDAKEQEYVFTYKTTVPDDATNVHNDSSIDPPGGGHYTAGADGTVTDRSWSDSKSTSGSLTATGNSNIYKAPWKIETTVPNNWETHTITDKIKEITGDKADHYGIAKDLQTEIENRLTFTLVDGSTMSYADAVKAGIDIKITYHDNTDYEKSGAKEIAADNTTDKVRSFRIVMTKTSNYKGKNIKKMTIDGYYTYVDVSSTDPGEDITIRNKLVEAKKEATYDYTKPKLPTDFEKGVSKNWAGYWSEGDYSDEVKLDYKEDGVYLNYQLELGITEFTQKELEDNELVVTDQLPAGLKYVDGSVLTAFRTEKGIGPIYRSDATVYQDWIDAFGTNVYESSNSKCFEISAGEYSNTTGQTLTFKFKGLHILNQEKEQFSGIIIRYKVQVDPELWKAWQGSGIGESDKDERTYINKAEWRGKQADATAIVKRKTDNVIKDVDQLKDEYGNNIGSAAYTVKINPGAKDLIPDKDTVTLTDTLTVQEGFTAELDLDSVQLYDAADTTFSNPLSRNLYTLQYTSTVVSGKNTYTMSLTVPDQRALVLKYTYKTSAGVNQKVTLDNTVWLAGEWSRNTNTTLKDIKAGGHISQSKLVVHKVDSQNQANGLNGAAFQLHWLNKNTAKWETSDKQHYTTEGSGTFTIYLGNEELTLQSDVLYKLTETKAPDGYRKSDTDYYFIFPSEDETNEEAYQKALNNLTQDTTGAALPALGSEQLMICKFGTQNDLYVTNERSQLLIQKFWTNQYNEAVTPTETEVTVKLYKYPEGGSKADGELVETITLTSAKDWKYTYDNLDVGYLYYIEEASTGRKYDVTYSDSNTNGVENGGLLTLTNKERADDGYELPSTGGTGTLPFTIAGGAMMLTALVYGVHRKRRHEGRAD